MNALLAAALLAAAPPYFDEPLSQDEPPSQNSSRQLSELFALPPPAPPPEGDIEVSFFTTAVFYNVAACGAVPSVFFDFQDVFAPGSGSFTICPPELQVRPLDSEYGPEWRCRVPGSYGGRTVGGVERGYEVKLNGRVANLTITLENPSAEDNEDSNVTSPIFVELEPTQRTNLIGSVLRPGTSLAACKAGFTIVREAQPLIGGGDFRNLFSNRAAGAVGTVAVVSNGDNLVTTLAQGETALLDHRLMSPTMMPQTVLIEFMEQKEGARLDRIDTKASVRRDEETNELIEGGAGFDMAVDGRLWGQTCEYATTGFVLYGAGEGGFPLRVLRVDGGFVDEEIDLVEGGTTRVNRLCWCARRAIFGAQFGAPINALTPYTPQVQ